MWDETKCLEQAQKLLPNCPETLVMLGSGWNHALSLTKVEYRVSYGELFGVETSVPGHSREMVVGMLAGKRVIFMSGRFHLYEGYSATEVTTPIRALASLGVKRMIVTSASGALNPDYQVGDFVVLSDLLTLFLRSTPLLGPQFLDMSMIFDPSWQERAKQAIEELGLTCRTGVYAYVQGPHFEPPADKRALLTLGADCVGMSTVPEVLMARQLGIKVLGLSLITNLAFVKHDHHDVMAAAERSSQQMAELIQRVI